MIKISYAITVCDEEEEIKKLIPYLLRFMRESDEIVIQQDKSAKVMHGAGVVHSYITGMVGEHDNVHFHTFPLRNDFSEFKNHLTAQCKGDYIFQLDADEIPSALLIEHLPAILEENKIDLIFVPRENLVKGITDDHIKKWNWIVDSKGRINYPDFQGRVFGNDPDRLKWAGVVHESIQGARLVSTLPRDEGYDILHHKTIEKQEKQNNLYSTM